ncbi:hypothetical protein EDEG_03624 [Edhazardia aedis USNM 41457]|uniref:Rad4 beta-hairpin domain-containing protein n=1 Tax=Edhazardia aedis (strain USNM 41457) TaxID=1003232 RepID=J8ZQD5_EDHAE|nr:hypothetical protein EDEG_03624 [Edhazardia aedis USNM 41457]|eukprot:EJW01908.1 hypothetical protein EDEG_03624 [Edhazardia aedis USNM 41457]
MDDSWDEVEEFDEQFIIPESKIKQNKNKRLKILNSLLQVIKEILDIELIKEYFDVLDVKDEQIIQNIVVLVKKHLQTFYKIKYDLNSHNIVLFLVLNVIKPNSCRLLIGIDEKRAEVSFLEVSNGNIFRDPNISQKFQNKTFSNKFVVSIDFLFNIKDHTITNSTQSMNLIFFAKNILENSIEPMKENFRKLLYEKLKSMKILDEKLTFEEYVNNMLLIKENCPFEKFDSKKLNEIPQSKNKLKIHPNFVMETLLNKRFIVFPKRQIAGYFKGEPIYQRKNVKQLYTINQLKKMGKIIKNSEKHPYRILPAKENSGEKVFLYAPWQVEDIRISSLNELIKQKKENKHKYADYFHENHIPVDSFYSSDPLSFDVCKMLRLPVIEVVTRFFRKTPIVEGVFIEIKNREIFQLFLMNYKYSVYIDEKTEMLEKTISLWLKVIKKTKKYIKIRQEIGFDESETEGNFI